MRQKAKLKAEAQQSPKLWVHAEQHGQQKQIAVGRCGMLCFQEKLRCSERQSGQIGCGNLNDWLILGHIRTVISSKTIDTIEKEGLHSVPNKEKGTDSSHHSHHIYMGVVLNPLEGNLVEALLW